MKKLEPLTTVQTLLIFVCALLLASTALAIPDRQIGQLAKAKFLYCRFKAEANEIVQQAKNKAGQDLPEVTLSKKAVNKIRSKQLAILKNKAARAKAKGNASLIVKNIKLCRKDRFDFPPGIDYENQPIDETVPLPVNREYESETNIISSAPELQGNCELYVKNLEAYQDGEEGSAIFAPQSGNLKCTFDTDFNYPIAVVVRDSNSQFVFSQKILPEQIKNRSFQTALCTEFAGCPRAKRAAIALSTGGIKVQIFSYEP